MAQGSQVPLKAVGSTQGWRVAVSDEWDVLGPFPIHAREQHFLSPSFPLNLSEHIDFEAKWPSAYADDGEVGWSKAKAKDGLLEVSFPEIRWSSLRAFEGWAALQHHAVLRTTINVYPPSDNSESRAQPKLLIDVKQGSFFAVLPAEYSEHAPADAYIPRWHTGNIYAMVAAPPHTIPLPVPASHDKPTTYNLFLSGDYEIRLFGDPVVQGSEVPKQTINIDVGIQVPQDKLTLVADHHVVPNFVDGWAFGDALGIGFHSLDGWWTVTEAKLPNELVGQGIQVRLLRETRIAPSQTRIVPLVITQTEPFSESSIALEVTASNSQQQVVLSVSLPIKHIPLWDASSFTPIISTYFFSTSTPTAFVAIPPKEQAVGEALPPLLFLHGAGVNVLDLAFWECAPPRQNQTWLVAPTGRTAWGLDWHGPSTADAWQSLAALSSILEHNPRWHDWRYPADTRVVLAGHSNGGQGTWHVAGRYPDRVVAAIPAAAYIKAQAYVPLLQSRSAHFVDPFLRAVLESALTPDDNDLFLTNLADTPILAIHGGDDENVPVWHTRALVDTLKTLNPPANVTFREDPGQPHCYSAVFRNEQTQAFIDASLTSSAHGGTLSGSESFTLTVAIPAESGSLHGWRIITLLTPGRLARLTVRKDAGGVLTVSTQNVRTFTIHAEVDVATRIVSVDGQELKLSASSSPAAQHTVFQHTQGSWQVEVQDSLSIQPSGRMSNILLSAGPIHVVISSKEHPSSLSAATRLAHALNVYHKLDVSILDAAEALSSLERGSLGESNMIILGDSSNALLAHILKMQQTPFRLGEQGLSLNGRKFAEGTSAVFLHPHPTSAAALVLVMYADSEAGMERALRLFPLRTGLTIPDWIVVNEQADSRGAGGVQAAGVWGDRWSWNGGMSSI